MAPTEVAFAGLGNGGGGYSGLGSNLPKLWGSHVGVGSLLWRLLG